MKLFTFSIFGAVIPAVLAQGPALQDSRVHTNMIPIVQSTTPEAALRALGSPQQLTSYASLPSLNPDTGAQVVTVAFANAPDLTYRAEASDPGFGWPLVATNATSGKFWVARPDRLNIRWLGANGDGVTDDGTAIKQGFMIANKLGMTMLVPDGEYKWIGNTALSLPVTNSFTVAGEGKAVLRVVNDPPEATKVPLYLTTGLSAVGEVSFRDLEIRGPAIFATDSSPYNLMRLEATNVTRFLIERCTFSGSENGAVKTSESVPLLVVENSIFSNDCLGTSGGSLLLNGTRTEVRGCSFSDIGNDKLCHAIYHGENELYGELIVDDCSFSGRYADISARNQFQQLSNLRFSDVGRCYSHTRDVTGYASTKPDAITISNVIVDKSGEFVLNYSRNVTLDGITLLTTNNVQTTLGETNSAFITLLDTSDVTIRNVRFKTDAGSANYFLNAAQTSASYGNTNLIVESCEVVATNLTGTPDIMQLNGVVNMIMRNSRFVTLRGVPFRVNGTGQGIVSENNQFVWTSSTTPYLYRTALASAGKPYVSIGDYFETAATAVTWSGLASTEKFQFFNRSWKDSTGTYFDAGGGVNTPVATFAGKKGARYQLVDGDSFYKTTATGTDGWIKDIPVDRTTVTSQRTSLDDSTDIMAQIGSAAPTIGSMDTEADWTKSGTGWTFASGQWELDNNPGELVTTANLTGLITAPRRYTLTVATPVCTITGTASVSVFVGNTQIGVLTNGVTTTHTFTGVRSSGADQKVKFVAVSGTALDVHVDNVTLKVWGDGDMMHEHSYAKNTLTPSSTAAPYLTIDAGGTLENNGNTKLIQVALAGSTGVPQIIQEFTTTAAAKDWTVTGNIYARTSGTASWNLVLWLDGEAVQAKSLYNQTLTGLAWNTDGYIYIGSETDTADADVTVNNSAVERKP